MLGKRIDRLFDRVCGMIPRLIAIFTLLFISFPLIIALVMSFSSSALAFPPPGFSLRWYEPLPARQDFIQSLGTSGIVAVCASGVSLGIGIPASLVMVRHQFKGRELLQVLFLSPLVIPGIVIGVSLLDFFISLRIYDAFPRLLIAHVIITLPYVIRVVSACLWGFDRTLEEAALNLGANEIQTFTKITLPLMKSGIIAAIVFAFQTSFNDIAVSVFLTSATFTTLPIVLLSWTYKYFDPSMAAVSGLIIASITCLLVITEKLVGIDKLLGAFTGIR